MMHGSRKGFVTFKEQRRLGNARNFGAASRSFDPGQSCFGIATDLISAFSFV